MRVILALAVMATLAVAIYGYAKRKKWQLPAAIVAGIVAAIDVIYLLLFCW